MKRGIQLSLVLASVLMAGLLFAAPKTTSALGTDITTTPISLDTVVTPGSSTTSNLQLLNNGTQPVPIAVSLQTFGAHGIDGVASIQPFAPNDPAPSWVHFSETSFVAEPGVWNSIKMTISLPKSAQLGYYYAVLFKPTNKITPLGHVANALTGSNAILVLVDTHSANEQRQIKLVSFSTTKKIYDYLPVTFNVTTENTGNIYLPPTGNVFISRDSEFKNTIASLGVNTTQGKVLPNSGRNFSTQWKQGFPLYEPRTAHGQVLTDSSGQPILQLKWDFSKTHEFRFGKYYAHLVLVYNNGVRDIPIESTLSFWVIPWELLFVGLVVLLIVVSGIGLVIWLILRGGKSLFANKTSNKRTYRR